jgi:hypothetical protein
MAVGCTNKEFIVSTVPAPRSLAGAAARLLMRLLAGAAASPILAWWSPTGLRGGEQA